MNMGERLESVKKREIFVLRIEVSKTNEEPLKLLMKKFLKVQFIERI